MELSWCNMAIISNIDEINKILRNCLITQSQVTDPKQVLNALSIYGDELHRRINNSTVYTSYEPNDVFILFELGTSQNANNVSFNEDDDEIDGDIVYQRAFNLRVMIYGNDSMNVSHKLASRLRTANVRESLLQQGIKIDYVDDPDTTKEFINNTLWFRSDFDINITCEMSIEQVSTDYTMTVLNGLTDYSD